MDLTFQVSMQYCSYGIGPCFYHRSHPQLGVFCFCFCFFFLLWLCPFIISGVISPLMSSSIAGTYWPWEFIFQCFIFLPFHNVHGVLKARVLKWLTIPFSRGPHFVRTLHHDPAILGGHTWHGLVSLS